MKRPITISLFTLLALALLYGYVWGWGFTTSRVEVKKVEIGDFGLAKSHVNFIRVKKNTAKFKVVNENHQVHDLWINANYFAKNGTPIGEVKIDGNSITKKSPGGAFFTSNGSEPAFYFGSRPNKVLYAAQTHTPLINKGKPNQKIFNRSWAKKQLPRLVVGKDAEGNFCVIHTIGLTACSVRQFYHIARDLGLVDALMFDGGLSIEVGVRDGFRTYKYQIAIDLHRKLDDVPTPRVFMVADFI